MVRPGQLGTFDEIESFAADLGLKVHWISLDDHFRCGGSESCLRWVQRLLGLLPGGPVEWDGDANFALDAARC